jgi:cephalosporin hydroxylase
MYIYVVVVLFLTQSSIIDSQKHKPRAKLKPTQVKALKINYPYSFFLSDSDDWKNSKQINKLLLNNYEYVKWNFAQDQEDIWLYENWFWGVEKGVILESGALDGIKYSTTHMFEKFAQWTSIHIGV